MDYLHEQGWDNRGLGNRSITFGATESIEVKLSIRTPRLIYFAKILDSYFIGVYIPKYISIRVTYLSTYWFNICFQDH